jgi:phosphatidylglycerol:prolipoprotein diacylglycerol transferase
VHPTQIYEAVALVPIAWVLFHWRKQRRPDTFVLGAYLILAGTIRFLIEFLRVNVRVIGPFSVAHLASLAAIAAGAVFFFQSPQVAARTSSASRLRNR